MATALFDHGHGVHEPLGDALGVCTEIDARFERGRFALIRRVFREDREAPVQAIITHPARRAGGGTPNAPECLEQLARIVRAALRLALDE